jgi:predicted MPP superfamily phosphohydrolase
VAKWTEDGVDAPLLNFLHLSDLHVGMSSDGLLWPPVRNAVLEDFRILFSEAGPPDVVIFSGDLTQKGGREEYERLQSILNEFWGVFKAAGGDPVLVPVPGNHDLVRRQTGDPVTHALKDWWKAPDIQESFWKRENTLYTDFVAQSFQNYVEFLNAVRDSAVRLPEKFNHGVIPGDIAVELTVRGEVFGLVGLNSAWLQVDGSDFKGLLHVDPRQLEQAVGGDPDAWCARHVANLLVTHHPESWLAPTSQAAWRSEILCGSRFDCHLFGHMHEQYSSNIAEGGHEPRRLMQAASLFGMELAGPTKIKRIHGYALGQIFRTNGAKTLRQWPRIDTLGNDGVRKLVPNMKFKLIDYRYFDSSYGGGEVRTSGDAILTSVSLPGNAKILDAIRKILPVSDAAAHVRQVEQQICLENLLKHRLVWIAADWGLGADEFLGVVVDRLEPAHRTAYKLDFGGLLHRDQLFAGMRRDLGQTFQQICDCIALEDKCFLIFDDVAVDDESGDANANYVTSVSQLAKDVLEYCPNVSIVIRSRRRPALIDVETIQLQALNGVDAMNYIHHHKLGGKELADESFVRKLFSHTDGIPSRIDSALRDIEILGVEELHLANTDVSGRAALTQPAPPGLAETLAKLEQDEDPGSYRAFRLLSALSMFPRGEYLESVKRFDHASPFHLHDARRLIDLALVDTAEHASIAHSSILGSAKALVVKRPVREFLATHILPESAERLNRQALTLYFGDRWNAGTIKPMRNGRFSDHACENWKIDNATVLVLREAKEAIDSELGSRIVGAATLAEAFCTALENGSHYGSLTAAATEFLAIYKDIPGQGQRLNVIRSMLGRALRMSSYWQRARDVLGPLTTDELPKAVRRRNFLALALASESLGADEDAKRYATSCIRLDKKSGEALHAESILADLSTVGKPERKAKLLAIAKAASKRGIHVLANNLLLTCMHESDNEEERRSLADQVSKAASRENDHYNGMRVALRLCEKTVQMNKPLNAVDLSKMIDSYHYFLNESMDALFDTAHRVLWKHFTLTADRLNLLSLFRYSSFKWQLRGKSGADGKYATEILGLLDDQVRLGISGTSREVAYLILRSERATKLLN